MAGYGLLAALATGSALAFGCLAYLLAHARLLQGGRLNAVRVRMRGSSVSRLQEGSAVDQAVMSLARLLDRRLAGKGNLPFEALVLVGKGRISKQMARAGLEGNSLLLGLCGARWALGIAVAVLLWLAGSLFSGGLAAAASLGGFAMGFGSVYKVLSDRVSLRRGAMEAELSPALEVIGLGMRSGLSFDRALGMYCAAFDGVLGRELESARRMWQADMGTRENLLRSLAASYELPVFSRFVDAVVRSMRFGSPLAPVLEDLAGEVREHRKALVQEQVMKAPVKVMVPIGTLILPSMLILVLGPVLLDLMHGF